MKNKTEFAIGEKIKLGLLTVICKESIEDNCRGCVSFETNLVQCNSLILGECQRYKRTDKKSVIFKLKEE